MNKKRHWQRTYAKTPPDALGWYTPRLHTSLNWIGDLSLPGNARIIDVGGGASTLVDSLVAGGYHDLTVLDLSGAALGVVQSRLGPDADRVRWLEGDIRSVELAAGSFDLWHDRATLHFLVRANDRRAYAEQLRRALKPGGCAIIGVFSTEAPPRCNRLPVHRFTTEAMQELLGGEFALERHQLERHITPIGTEQMFLYCQVRRTVTPQTRLAGAVPEP